MKSQPWWTLLSAWRDKFDVNAPKHRHYVKNYGDLISKYTTEDTHKNPGYAAPFSSFASFIAHDARLDGVYMNSHWEPYFKS